MEGFKPGSVESGLSHRAPTAVPAGREKTTFIIVGGFRSPADGSVGGQLYACRTLIESPISEQIDWIELDSTMESVPPPGLPRRSFLAGKRLLLFVGFLLRRRPDGALIFVADGSSFLEKGLMVFLARLWRRRVVLSPRSGYLLDHVRRWRFMRWYVQMVFRCSHLVLCQSESWKEAFQSVSGLPASRFRVVRNWIDTGPYVAPSPVEHDGFVRVLFMGWVEREKGIYEIVEAVKQFRDALQKTRFIICGRGSQVENLQREIAEQGLSSFFEFRGWVRGAEKIEAFKQADIFVLPSHGEGMPNALLEAMAAGRAVIATRVGGIPEVIADHRLGRLVDVGDVQGLGHALVELCDRTLIRRLGKEAQSYVLKHHDISRVWPQILEAIQFPSRS